MQFAQSAAARIIVELELMPRARRQAAWGGALLDLVLGVVLGLGIAGDVTVKEIVVRRVGSDEVVTRGPIRRMMEGLVEEMRGDLPKLDEADWMEKWGDPTRWKRAWS